MSFLTKKPSALGVSVSDVDIEKKSHKRLFHWSNKPEKVKSTSNFNQASTQVTSGSLPQQLQNQNSSEHVSFWRAITNGFKKGSGCSPQSVPTRKDEDFKSIRKMMEDIREIISPANTEEIVIGHKNVKDAIMSAFLLANALPTQLHHSLECKNILIAGLGGLGKTEMMKAQAVAAAKILKTPISLFNVKASDLMSKYIGESEKSVAALWEVIEKYAPSLVIFDEVDGLMKARSQDETDSTRRFKTALLSEMRGNRKLEQVVVVAATNRAEDLDENFLSRFRLKFVVNPPTDEERKLIFEKFLRIAESNTKVDWGSIDYRKLANRTNGFSGNDIATVVSRAVSSCFRITFQGNLYKVGEINVIKEELEKLDKAVEGLLVPLTMEVLLSNLEKVKPSICGKNVRKLKKWATQNAENASDSNEDIEKIASRCETKECSCGFSCLPF